MLMWVLPRELFLFHVPPVGEIIRITRRVAFRLPVALLEPILIPIGDELVGVDLRIEVVEIVRIHHGMIIGEELDAVKPLVCESGECG